MPELKEIGDKIQNTWEQMKAKNDEAIAESKKALKSMEDYRAEDRIAFDKFNAALDAQKKQMDDMALKIERTKLVGTQLAEVKNPEHTKAFLKWMRQGKAALEPTERKALVEDLTGLYLVPEEISAEIIRGLPQLNYFRQLCIPVTIGRDKLRKRTLTEVTMSWGKIEGTASISESTPTPATGYIYAEDLYGLTKIGEDELADLDFNLPAIIADSFSIARANTEEAGFAVGRGHATYEEPEGIAVDATLQTSIGSGNGAGTTGTYGKNWTTDDTVLLDDVLYAEYLLPTQYLNGASWMMNRKTEYAMRILRAEVASGYYGNYLWQPSFMAGQPNTFDGYPIRNNNSMKYPADTTAGINIIFGNFRMGYRIVDRLGMTMQRLDELYAEDGLVGFKTHFRVGGAIIRHDAFTVVCNDV